MSSQRKRPGRKQPEIQCDRTIVLVGMMGAGKTTIGRRLAPRLGLPFFDADLEIEKAAGMSVAELFRMHGEASFRRGEAQVMARLLQGPPCVLATGGGALLDPNTRRLIKEHGLSVWLKTDADTIMKRAGRRGTRPLLNVADPRAVIESLLKEREPLYAQADLAIESGAGPHGETVDALIEALRPLIATGRPQNGQKKKAKA